MCTYPVQPICTFSCTSVFFINIYYPQYTVLHILSHCTSYSFYFIICSLFHSHLYLYIYILLCYVSLFYCLCYFYFIFYFIIIIIIIIFFFFCTFHWADLSWPTFHYWLYPVWLCMWQIIKNLENLEPWTLWQKSAAICFKMLVFHLGQLKIVQCVSGFSILSIE